jgi:hypothetical protein
MEFSAQLLVTFNPLQNVAWPNDKFLIVIHCFWITFQSVIVNGSFRDPTSVLIQTSRTISFSTGKKDNTLQCPWWWNQQKKLVGFRQCRVRLVITLLLARVSRGKRCSKVLYHWGKRHCSRLYNSSQYHSQLISSWWTERWKQSSQYAICGEMLHTGFLD